LPAWRPPLRRSRIATPDLRQGETAECGLAALAILLAHHGRPVPLETLRTEAGSTRLGSTARTLLTLARRHDMEARAFRKEPEGLAALGFPLIVHSRFIHFLVVEGMTSREVLVNDPACGPRSIPLDEFADDFTGIALTLRPLSREPLPESGRGRWLRALGDRLSPQRGTVLAIPALALLAETGTVAACLSVGGLAEGHPAAPPVLAVAATMAVAAAWARDRRVARLGERLGGDTAAAMLARLSRLPAHWFARRSMGQVAAAPLAGGLLQTHIGAALVLAETPLVLMPALVALAIDPLIGAVLTAGAAASALALALVHGRRGGIVARLGAGGTTAVLPDAETLRAIDSHKTGGRDAELFGQLAGRHAHQCVLTQEAATSHAALTALRTGLAAAGLALAVGLGALAIAEGRLGTGPAVALAALAVALHRPFGRLDRLLPGRAALRTALHRLADTESAPLDDTTDDAADDAHAPRPRGRLVLDKAGFQPSPLLPPVLAGIDLTVEPGQRVGVTGPSGSGKSVLAKLACGLLDAGPGGVRLDGQPVAAVARRWPGAVALVDRSTPVEPGTVADNLRFGDRTLSDSALTAALDLVALTADLEPRGGLSLSLSRGGAELSGGQRRRLALARALLRKPALLVLDEALDALEPDLDRAIRDRLRDVGCTVLLVSRRPSSLAGCDHVIDLGAAP